VPAPLPRVNDTPIPDYPPSPSLSLLARPGYAGIRTRRVAIAVANGVDAAAVRQIYASLLKDGAQPRVVGQHLGEVSSVNGKPIDVEVSFEATPSVMYDAVVLPPGEAASAALARDGRVLEFLRDQYRHDKPLLVLGAGRQLVAAAGLPVALPNGEPDPGLVIADPANLNAALAAFKTAIMRHKVYVRETDPPRV
jgi:catalase